MCSILVRASCGSQAQVRPVIIAKSSGRDKLRSRLARRASSGRRCRAVRQAGAMPSRMANAARSSSAAARLESTPGAGLHRTSGADLSGVFFEKRSAWVAAAATVTKYTADRGERLWQAPRNPPTNVPLVKIVAGLFRRRPPAGRSEARSSAVPDGAQPVPEYEGATEFVQQHDGCPPRVPESWSCRLTPLASTNGALTPLAEIQPIKRSSE